MGLCITGESFSGQTIIFYFTGHDVICAALFVLGTYYLKNNGIAILESFSFPFNRGIHKEN
jgi:hypothetical protein